MMSGNFFLCIHLSKYDFFWCILGYNCCGYYFPYLQLYQLRIDESTHECEFKKLFVNKFSSHQLMVLFLSYLLVLVYVNVVKLV